MSERYLSSPLFVNIFEESDDEWLVSLWEKVMCRKNKILIAAAVLLSTSLVMNTNAQEEFSQEEVNSWFETLSNWGRWGADDQLGTVNLLSLIHI